MFHPNVFTVRFSHVQTSLGSIYSTQLCYMYSIYCTIRTKLLFACRIVIKASSASRSSTLRDRTRRSHTSLWQSAGTRSSPSRRFSSPSCRCSPIRTSTASRTWMPAWRSASGARAKTKTRTATFSDASGTALC